MGNCCTSDKITYTIEKIETTSSCHVFYAKSDSGDEWSFNVPLDDYSESMSKDCKKFRLIRSDNYEDIMTSGGQLTFKKWLVDNKNHYGQKVNDTLENCEANKNKIIQQLVVSRNETLKKILEARMKQESLEKELQETLKSHAEKISTSKLSRMLAYSSMGDFANTSDIEVSKRSNDCEEIKLETTGSGKTKKDKLNNDEYSDGENQEDQEIQEDDDILRSVFFKF